MPVSAGVVTMTDGETPAWRALQDRIDQHTGVAGCARCDGQHDRLEWHRFRQPIEVSVFEFYTGWATCPTTGDPIMFVVQHVKESTP